MLIQLQNGEIIEIDDMIDMDYENWEKVREAYDAAIEEIKRLRRENEVLVDAALSNSVLRKNAEKSKKINAFAHASSKMFRRAIRAIWHHAVLNFSEIDENGIRVMTIHVKGNDGLPDYSKGSLLIPMPAQRAMNVETVCKPDGSFANRQDVIELMAQEKRERLIPDDSEQAEEGGE